LARIVGSTFDGAPVDVRAPEPRHGIQATVGERPPTVPHDLQVLLRPRPLSVPRLGAAAALVARSAASRRRLLPLAGLGCDAEVGESAVAVEVEGEPGHLPVADVKEVRPLGPELSELHPARPAAPGEV